MSEQPPTSGPNGSALPPGATERPPRRPHRRPGDGWVQAPDGNRYWGLYGAAGLLLHDAERGILLQHRVAWSAHGGTWGIPGGAIDPGEDALAGAIRECHEESGVPALDGTGIEVTGTHVLDKGVWSYTTVIARALVPMEPHINDPESLELAWVPVGEVEGYRLHPGFADAWPELRGRLGAGGATSR